MDYWSKFAVTMPVTPEQGAWLCSVHDTVEALIQAFEDNDEGEPAAAEWRHAPDEVAVLAHEYEDSVTTGIEVSYDREEGATWVQSVGGLGNYDYTARLIQLFLQHFHLDTVVEFEWALDCSRPVPDGYGGGGAVVSRRGIRAFQSYHLVKAAARKEKLRLAITKEATGTGMLDREVRRLVSEIANLANQGGVDAQLEFLLDNGWTPSPCTIGQEG